MLLCKNPGAGKRPRARRNMHFTLEVCHNLLRAELFGRQTAEEMQEFIRALNAEIRRSGCNLALICVRHSLPLFQAEQYAGLTPRMQRGHSRRARR